MKCKAVCSGLSAELVRALNKLRPTILEQVVGPHLHRPGLSSAGFYVQETDLADPETHEPFCEVRLTGVSATDDRSVLNFLQARATLEDVYRTTILGYLKSGQRVKLFVSLMLDSPPKLGMSTLIEGNEETVAQG